MGKKILLSILIILLFGNTYLFAQSYEDFKADFKSALDEGFSRNDLEQIIGEYDQLLILLGEDVSEENNVLGGHKEEYPLVRFKGEEIYKKNISHLLNSKNPNHRILACAIITSANETGFNQVLLDRLNTEKDKEVLNWTAMSLLNLKSTHTMELFDFLLKNQKFGSFYLIPFYLKLDKDLLQETAYLRINDHNMEAKVLAAQILSKTGLNPKTERILKEAVQSWGIDWKGYAIYSLKELQAGNLLSILKPLSNNPKVKRIVLEALANSPSQEDQQYLLDLINANETLSKEILDALYYSKKPENVKKWLILLVSKSIPDGYSFSTYKQPLLKEDYMLQDVLNVLKNNKTPPEIISELVSAFRGRTDEDSVNTMISLLKYPDSTVRYWAGTALEGNSSQKLIQILPYLLSDAQIRSVALINLVIQNNLDNLQPVIEEIYQNDSDSDWRRGCIEYFSHFPLDKHKPMLKALLEDKKEDIFIRRSAAIGLGRLQDKDSVDLIVKICREMSEKNDFNALPFLVTLRMIKGEQAKSEVESYLNSKDPYVRQFVGKILQDWESSDTMGVERLPQVGSL